MKFSQLALQEVATYHSDNSVFNESQTTGIRMHNWYGTFAAMIDNMPRVVMIIYSFPKDAIPMINRVNHNKFIQLCSDL